jgi:hypothetical protein
VDTDDALNDREAKSNAVAFRSAPAVKWFEDKIEVGFWDAGAGVFDPKDRLVALTKHGDIDPGLRWRKSQPVSATGRNLLSSAPSHALEAVTHAAANAGPFKLSVLRPAA